MGFWQLYQAWKSWHIERKYWGKWCLEYHEYNCSIVIFANFPHIQTQFHDFMKGFLDDLSGADLVGTWYSLCRTCYCMRPTGAKVFSHSEGLESRRNLWVVCYTCLKGHEVHHKYTSLRQNVGENDEVLANIFNAIDNFRIDGKVCCFVTFEICNEMNVVWHGPEDYGKLIPGQRELLAREEVQMYNQYVVCIQEPGQFTAFGNICCVIELVS